MAGLSFEKGRRTKKLSLSLSLALLIILPSPPLPTPSPPHHFRVHISPASSLSLSLHHHHHHHHHSRCRPPLSLPCCCLETSPAYCSILITLSPQDQSFPSRVMKLSRSRTSSRIKPFSPSSPRPSLLSSWLLKLRKIGIDRSDRRRDRRDRQPRPTTSSPAATRHYNSPSEVVSPPKRCGVVVKGEEVGRFLEGDGGFWRLSFRAGRMFDAEEEGRFSGDLLGPIWCRSDGDKETNNFEEMVSGIRMRRESRRRSKSLPEMKVESAERETELKTPRRRKVKRERKLGIRSDGKVSEAKNHDRIPSEYSTSPRKSVEDSEFPWSSISEMQKPEGKSDRDDTNREKQRKSLYITRKEPPPWRPKQSSRVRVHSPRTARIEVRRPRSPVEDTKKVNSKSTRGKTKTKNGAVGNNTKANRLERFAVVKCSYDPQRDFRESMMEMIVERRIRRSEEMEELLACYLTLNSDEYHELIIKVFRQVWFELNQACLDW